MSLSISHRIRQWLLDNPGRHFSRDVQEGLGARSPKARATVAALLSNMAQEGLLDRAGKAGTYRYWANELTGRIVGQRPNRKGRTALEQAFEESCDLVHNSAQHLIEWVRKRAAQIAADRIEVQP